MWGSNNNSDFVISLFLFLNIDCFLLSLIYNNGYVVSTKSIPDLLREASVWFAVTELLTVPIIIVASIVITGLDYFLYFVVTLGRKSNRIEENIVTESSLQVVIPIVHSSGIKC